MAVLIVVAITASRPMKISVPTIDTILAQLRDVGCSLPGRTDRGRHAGPVGTLVVGGAVGNEVGQRLGRALIAGDTAFVKTLTS
jgi:hypothetical protein